MSFQVGIVGATGKVGQTFLKLLEQENFPVKSLKLFASPANQGKTIYFKGTPFKIQTLSPHCFKDLDMVFFSAGENISREWAPQAVQDGAIAIDNSSAFRMDEQYPLVVPEINAHLLPLQSRKPTIIANPNCSTIQLVMALNPLKKFGLQSVKVATYQAVSGAGKEAQMELLQQTEQFLQAWKSSLQEPPEEVLSQKQNLLEHHHFPVPILFNCIPQIGRFDANGFCGEELKIIHETKKILDLPELRVSAFTVRVPVMNAHSEAVWVTLKEKASYSDLSKAFHSQSGLVPTLEDSSNYPTALNSSSQKDTFIGRLHQDLEDPQTWLFWVVADNILKGAAWNGLQIAQKIFLS